MPITRAGGYIKTEDRGWVLEDSVEVDDTPSPSMSNSKAELLAAAEAAGVEVAEDATKRQILEALDGVE
jgi:hypothetical protein